MPVSSSTMSGAPRRPALPPERLYLTEEEWLSAARIAQGAALEPGAHEAVPVFAERPRPRSAFMSFLDAQLEAGRRVVLTAASAGEQAKLRRRLRRR